MAQSPQEYLPPFQYVGPKSVTWGAGGNNCVVTDDAVNSNSLPDLIATSAVAGTWHISNVTPTSSTTNASTGVITTTAGSFTVTSSDSESSGVTFSYKLN